MNHLTNYNNLKTRNEKRLYCISIDKDKVYTDRLLYDKISLFSINVYFERLTGIKVNQDREQRIINYKDKRNF